MARHRALVLANSPALAGFAVRAGVAWPDTPGRRGAPNSCHNFGPAMRQLILPPLCRPSGWVALWRRLGNLSILNRKTALLP